METFMFEIQGPIPFSSALLCSSQLLCNHLYSHRISQTNKKLLNEECLNTDDIQKILKDFALTEISSDLLSSHLKSLAIFFAEILLYKGNSKAKAEYHSMKVVANNYKIWFHHVCIFLKKKTFFNHSLF